MTPNNNKSHLRYFWVTFFAKELRFALSLSLSLSLSPAFESQLIQLYMKITEIVPEHGKGEQEITVKHVAAGYLNILLCLSVLWFPNVYQFSQLLGSMCSSSMLLLFVCSSSMLLLFLSSSIKVLSKETLTDYIEGELEQLPEPSPPHQQSSLMSELYYLLADDYLKSGDNQYDSLHSNLFVRRDVSAYFCVFQ